VLVHGAAADSVEAEALVTAGVPHLAVVVRERGLLVGPLVLPGRAPCLRCLDLHRTDRDPAWPTVLAQLTAPQRPPVPEEAASALLAASLAALQVLGHLDGRVRPAALGATLEVELPDGLISRRPWSAHPGCACGSAVRRGDTRGHRERTGGPEGTMKT
jgi:bacteriocin biosynthesis cyclodehydratase domain-containing protein